jgi:hypothetical protein
MRMRVPKGKPVHEGLNTSYVNVGALLADLQVNNFTGYVEVLMTNYEAYVFIDAGAIIGALEQTEATARVGSEAINGLLVQAQQPGGKVSIYQHASKTVQAIAGIVDSRAVHQGLSSEFTDLDRLVAKLRRDRDADWYVEVIVGEERGVGIIFIEGGEPDGVYSPTSGTMVTGAPALAAMSEAAESFSAVFDVYSATTVQAEEEPPKEPEAVSAAAAKAEEAPSTRLPDTAVGLDADSDALAPLVVLMSEVVSAIEHVVTARDGAGSFAIELRAGQLEVAEAYPFLDPFAAEFEYHAGEIAFVGNVDAEEFAVGLGEALHVTVSALARRDGVEGEKLRQRIADALAELYESRPAAFDAFGLAGLLTYIAEPEAMREAEARLGESA